MGVDYFYISHRCYAIGKGKTVSVSLEHSQHILRTGVSGEGGDLDDDDDDHDTHILKT